ncbi:acetoacetyl-CoA synthetase [Nephila pilipes]|uniref:Acetoacetyl-CoA synthetase n=1 Tax=Nephila pilipes TaxID=299642 RepID=A0A8X6UIH2_NEPPI|nr:acetoacetyl-CoA synthetase [Nephila pilipes]
MDNRRFAEVPLIWEPKESDGKEMKKFKKIIEDKYFVKLDGYLDLHKWSIEHLPEFWGEMWDFIGIISSKRFDSVIDLNVLLSRSPKWFEGAKLNYAENLLKYRDERAALIVTGEDSDTQIVTYAQMFEEARLYAAAFRKFGLKKGDVVVCYMSNRKEAIFAMQAVVSIGAIWTGALPFLGVEATLKRFQQLNPKVLLTVDQYPFRGQKVDLLSKVKEIVKGLTNLKKVLIVASKPDSHSKDISGIKNSCFLDEFLEQGLDADGSIPPMKFEQVSFSHPVVIIHTSGTTGLPKAVMQGSGILMAPVGWFSIVNDCDRDTRWLHMTPVGSIIWVSHIAMLFWGATLVLYEGYPFSPNPGNFWNLIENFKINNALAFPIMIDELQKRRIYPTKTQDISSLKQFFVGGSPIKKQNFDFMNEISNDGLFSASYGGTEIAGIGITVSKLLPIYKGELNTVMLGASMKVVDTTGNPVVGEIGEIVLSKSTPTLPLGFWNDEDGSEYREEYFSKYLDLFATGDSAMINPVTKNWIILCRCDESLNPKGTRFGASEIYDVVERFLEVQDSLCVSQYNKDMDERAVLFLKIRNGRTYSEELVARIRKAIEKHLSVLHVPDIIIEIQEIPYNISSKKTELIVKKIINNQPYNDDTVRNPECLKYYSNIPILQDF